MNFQDFNLHPAVMAGVEALGYTEPTPIQEKAIPHILQGRDIIGLAQTGTGKTAAFVLPILQRILGNPRGRISALVISPTRELAEQTCDVVDHLGYQTRLRSIAIYGGVGMDQQVQRLRSGVDIAVACPGRLLDHVWKGTIDLSHVQILVIDEADRMFDMGFLPDIKSILKCLVQKRQTLLFSATMPEDIRRLVRDAQHNPVTVQIGRVAPAAAVSHAIYPVKQHLKGALLIEILRRTNLDSVLVFTRTKRRADRVSLQLQRAGFKTASLHGDLAQSRRQAALDAFRSGRIRMLVATDIAARGIDISDISHVVNFDMPENIDAYIHRIGRTGRVDRSGDALTLVTGEDASMVRDIEQALKKPLERIVIPDFDYNRAAPEVKPSVKTARPRQARQSRRPKAISRRATGN
jgi:ATP-dependent RNA helicase RhlE